MVSPTLLKTNLFVVIAAVDARYVCLSLEQKEKYKHILHNLNSPTGLDFMEKIIQVAYNLPAIADESMDKLVKDQIDIEEDESNEKSEKDQDAIRPDQSPTTNDSEEEEKAEIEPSEPGNVTTNSDIEKTSGNESTDTQSEDKVDTEETQEEPDNYVIVEEQRFTKEEADILSEACQLFRLVPRDVKRVVNVFKIMKMI